MNSDYHWSAVSPTATGRAAFLSMRLCGSPSADVLPPASAIATQAASGIAASVVQAADSGPKETPKGPRHSKAASVLSSTTARESGT